LDIVPRRKRLGQGKIDCDNGKSEAEIQIALAGRLWCPDTPVGSSLSISFVAILPIRANLNQSLGQTLLHDRAVLINELPFPRHKSATPATLDLASNNLGVHMNRVSDEDWFEKPPVNDAYEGSRAHTGTETA
jgi:hypothetical protein